MDWSTGNRHGIRLTEEEPFLHRHKRIAPGDVRNLRKQLKELEDAGIIKNVDNLPIPKKLVTHQVNVTFSPDFHHFKERKVPDLFSDLNIENALNCMVGNECFSVLGVISDLCQIPMYPGEREHPYSVCPLGFYETERMQPGYCEALATFQRLMTYILRDINMQGMLVYLDYIVVFGKTFEEHQESLTKVFDRLQKDNWTVSMEKSVFCVTGFYYAGHVVSGARIAIDPSKIEVMSTWPKPRTVTELQCFLDFCRYYQQFLEGFSKMAKPLNQLLQKVVKEKEMDEIALLVKKAGNPWWTRESIEEKWTKECEEAFDQLKHSIIHAPVLARANMTQPHKPPMYAKTEA